MQASWQFLYIWLKQILREGGERIYFFKTQHSLNEKLFSLKDNKSEIKNELYIPLALSVYINTANISIILVIIYLAFGG